MSYNKRIADAVKNVQLGVFFKAFYEDEKLVKFTLPYDPAWVSDTHYLNHAVKSEFAEMDFGDIARSACPGNSSQRRILIVKTYFGNVVLFDRYAPEPSGTLNGALVFNAPHALSHPWSGMLPAHTALSLEGVIQILGDGCFTHNIGLRLHNLMEAIAAKSRELLQ